MTPTTKEKLLKIALAAFGAIFLLVYPLGMIWPSGWVWHGGEGQYYLQMICGIYAVLARISHRGWAVTDAKRLTGKEKRAERCGSSDKWFDAACQPFGPALRVAQGGPSAASARSTV